MKYHSSEMAKRVLQQRVARHFVNADCFMQRVEEMFIASNARPINVIVSKIPVARRLRIYTPESETDVDRIATLEECQELVSIYGFPSNCYRCREQDDALSGEFMLQISLPPAIR